MVRRLGGAVDDLGNSRAGQNGRSGGLGGCGGEHCGRRPCELNRQPAPTPGGKAGPAVQAEPYRPDGQGHFFMADESREVPPQVPGPVPGREPDELHGNNPIADAGDEPTPTDRAEAERHSDLMRSTMPKARGQPAREQTACLGGSSVVLDGLLTPCRSAPAAQQAQSGAAMIPPMSPPSPMSGERDEAAVDAFHAEHPVACPALRACLRPRLHQPACRRPRPRPKICRRDSPKVSPRAQPIRCRQLFLKLLRRLPRPLTSRPHQPRVPLRRPLPPVLPSPDTLRPPGAAASAGTPGPMIAGAPPPGNLAAYGSDLPRGTPGSTPTVSASGGAGGAPIAALALLLRASRQPACHRASSPHPASPPPAPARRWSAPKPRTKCSTTPSNSPTNFCMPLACIPACIGASAFSRSLPARETVIVSNDGRELHPARCLRTSFRPSAFRRS